MKLESLVIANQLRGDEYVPESCTRNARQFLKKAGANPVALILNSVKPNYKFKS